MNIDYKTLSYNVNGVTDFTFEEAVQLWKCRHQTFENFKKFMLDEYYLFEDDKILGLIESNWDVLPNLTAADAFSFSNIEKRRVAFDSIGVENIMSSLKCELVNEQTITRENIVYDVEGNSKVETMSDTYSLYKVDKDKLFGDMDMRDWSVKRHNNDCYVVKCKDASTDRSYWIYVPESIGSSHDAIEAIAWTYTVPRRVKISAVHRQGEVIISEHSNDASGIEILGWMPATHLDKEHYIKLVKSQS